MKIYYNAKIKHNKEMDDGMLKQVTEDYLFDAVSYTDAEAKAYEYAERNISGEFSVTKITHTNISEVINHEDGDLWLKAKVCYQAVDGDSDKPININTYLLVSAVNVKQAYERIEDHLSSMLVPFSVPTIAETKILEVVTEDQKENESNPN